MIIGGLILYSPPSPLGGFFGNTWVNGLASDLSDITTVNVGCTLIRVEGLVLVTVVLRWQQPNPPNRFGDIQRLNYINRIPSSLVNFLP